MEVLYGVFNNYIDITEKVKNNYVKNGNIFIPRLDILRSYLFGDPVVGVKKHIKIVYNSTDYYYEEENEIIFQIIHIYYGYDDHYLDITNKALNSLAKYNYLNIPSSEYEINEALGDPYPNIKKNIKIIYFGKEIIVKNNECFSLNLDDLKVKNIKIDKHILEPVERLRSLHKKLFIQFGEKEGEYPEQLISVKYIDPKDVVLEIGGNIGRSSCVISSILDDSSNLVVLETCPLNCETLKFNKNINGFSFHIENSALSYKPLTQINWNTYLQENDIIPEGHMKVKTITFEEILEKYKHKFNTLVLDCEGAIYQILIDNPNILSNINKIIIENDFDSYEKKKFVDNIFYQYGFHCIYNEKGGWGECEEFFYQVFIKKV